MPKTSAARTCARAWAPALLAAVLLSPASRGAALDAPPDPPLPGPIGVPGPRPRLRPASVPEPSAPETPSAPTGLGDFSGPEDNSRKPPDSMGAVGQDQIVTLTNSGIAVQSRDGTVLQSLQSLDAFFAAEIPGANCTVGDVCVFDPKVHFDEESQRFFLVAIAGPALATNHVVYAVSKSSNPLDGWNRWTHRYDAGGQFWYDFPGLGISQRFIAFTGNVFSVSASTFCYIELMLLDKADLLNGVASPVVRHFGNQGDAVNRGVLMPSISYGVPEIYLVQTGHFNTNNNNNRMLKLFSLTGTSRVAATFQPLCPSCAGGPGLVEVIDSHYNLPAAGGQTGVPQGPGWTTSISTAVNVNNDRMLSVVYRHDALWAAHHVGLPLGTAARTGVAWYKLSLSGEAPAPVMQGIIQHAATSYYYPSLAVDPFGNVALGFSGSSADLQPSAFYVTRRSSDPPNYMSEPVAYKLGGDPYDNLANGRNRWGDYSATMPDPKEPGAFWTIQEVSGGSADPPVTPTNDWQVWWARFTAFDLPTSSVTNVRGSVSSADRIDFLWDAHPQATSYDVFEGGCAGAAQNQTATTYSISGLTANTERTLCVKPRNVAGLGTVFSDAVTTATYAGAVTVTGKAFSTFSATVDYATSPSAGYRLEVHKNASFTDLVASSETPNQLLARLAVVGLSSSTQYFARVGARNTPGHRVFADGGSFTTPALVEIFAPAAQPFSQVGATTIQAHWGQGSNPGGLLYHATAYTDASLTTVAQTSATYNLFAGFSSLVSDTTYWFAVAPAGGPGVTLSSAVTLAPAPTGLAVAGPHIDSTTLSWVQGYAGSTFYEAEASLNSAFSAIVLSPSGRFTSVDLAPLAPNTSYYFRVRAVNHSGVASAYGATLTAATLAGPPTLPAEPYVAVTYTSATVRWSHPGAQAFRVDASLYADFSGELVTAQTTDPAAAAGFGVSGLTQDTTYWLRIGAVGPDGRASYA
ncbi:MAG: fibronectin type III domain-containing protein, partial [Elusimicrobia bacterium]|nr:fibronectin type III domain-containing protein [Elusimicrobiota bacterium]